MLALLAPPTPPAHIRPTPAWLLAELVLRFLPTPLRPCASSSNSSLSNSPSSFCSSSPAAPGLQLSLLRRHVVGLLGLLEQLGVGVAVVVLRRVGVAAQGHHPLGELLDNGRGDASGHARAGTRHSE
eukprot:6645608-Pyramimonas_sp.AAC.1